jgi:transposase-like protein
MAKHEYPENFEEFLDLFSTEQDCWEYLVKRRWSDGFSCPACKSKNSWLINKRLFECKSCGKQTSVTAGTIFQDSRKPLRLWFHVMWFLVAQRHGISAKNLMEMLGLGGYETAWTWLHKLRRAMIRQGRDRLQGEVEIDETFIGGESEGARGRGSLNKSIVVVAVEIVNKKPGRVRFRIIPAASKEYLFPFIKDNVEPGATVITDGWTGYEGADMEGKYNHVVKNISASQKKAHELLPYVHLIDSLLKRWLLGTHQGAVLPNQLMYYLDEFSFRFNRRLSQHRGKLFLRLIDQSVDVLPHTYDSLVAFKKRKKPQI